MVKIINEEVGFFAMEIDGTPPAFRVLFLKYFIISNQVNFTHLLSLRDLKTHSQNVILCASFVSGTI